MSCAVVDAAVYPEGKPFTCLDGELTIDFSAVNDDYCDCSDGSDEPGTSACGHTIFYCTNAGSAALSIPSYRVNDGVCDCCDATDEFETGACANDCEVHGRALREAQAAQRLLAAAGYKLRRQNMADGTTKRSELETSMTPLKAKQMSFQSRLDAATVVKDAAEAPENAAKKTFDDAWTATLADRKTEAHTKLFAKLDTDGNAMLTVGELQTFAELKSDDATEGVTTVEDATAILDINDDKELDAEEAACTLESFAENIFDEIADKFTDAKADETTPEYDEAIKLLIQAADAKRKLRTDIETEKKTVDNDLAKIEKELKYDWGAHNEFAYMLGNCYEVAIQEYTYKVCPFDSAKQGSTSLGNFDGFEAAPNKGTYSRMKFTGGQKCWNGPARSLTVDLVCGTETKPGKVEEPSKCEYHATMSTPAVCDPPPPHDEL
jgi:protein kinase C substrate 80K-H